MLAVLMHTCFASKRCDSLGAPAELQSGSKMQSTEDIRLREPQRGGRN